MRNYKEEIKQKVKSWFADERTPTTPAQRKANATNAGVGADNLRDIRSQKDKQMAEVNKQLGVKSWKKKKKKKEEEEES